MRILIAEDSAVDTILLRNIVGRMGHDALAVTDGEEALRALERHPEIGLALVDICLPGMSGIELVRTMRNDSRLADIPVLFASGVSEAETVHQAAALRPEGYILKPFNEPSLIVSRIRQVEERVSPVILDETAIQERTGLGSAGVRALRAQLGHRLGSILEVGEASADQVLALRGLAHQTGAQRLLTALDEEASGGWKEPSRLRREAQAVVNCLAEDAA